MAGEKDSTNRSVNWKLVAMMVLMLIALQWLWPNVVHEPLHIVALYAQGSTGTIDFDFSFPAHPTVTRTSDLNGVPGALLFYLLPSIVSILILFGLWIRRNKGSVWSHFVLPAYLGFDLIINLRGYQNLTSDFRVLTLVPSYVSLVIIAIVALATIIVLTTARCHVQEYCLMEVFHED
jgi:hypothetical protein